MLRPHIWFTAFLLLVLCFDVSASANGPYPSTFLHLLWRTMFWMVRLLVRHEFAGQVFLLIIGLTALSFLLPDDISADKPPRSF